MEGLLSVSIDSFDGPLSLLLALIQNGELSLDTLDISEVTKRYLDFLALLKEIDFDVAADYLYLAATLVWLKSKSTLLGKESLFLQETREEETVEKFSVESQEELIKKLKELERYQKLAKKIGEMPRLGENFFIRPKIKKNALMQTMLIPLDLTKLVQSYLDFLKRQKRKIKIVKRDRFSIKERLKHFISFFNKGDETTFSQLVDQTAPMNFFLQEGNANLSLENLQYFKELCVITFISLLELAKCGKIELFQNINQAVAFPDIYIKVKDDLRDFDIEGLTLTTDFSEMPVSNQLTQY